MITSIHRPPTLSNFSQTMPLFLYTNKIILIKGLSTRVLSAKWVHGSLLEFCCGSGLVLELYDTLFMLILFEFRKIYLVLKKILFVCYLQIDTYEKEILSDLLKNITSNQWRIRESRYTVLDVTILSLIIFLGN